MNYNLLIVEDEYNIGNSLVDMLKLNNFNATLASDGRAALDCIRENEYDLILCDINLPDIDGYEILNVARTYPKYIRTPFIFLTAFAEKQDVRKGMNLGADDYITKPFSIATILDAVNSRLLKKETENNVINNEVGKKWLEMLNNNFNHEFLTPLNGILSAGFMLEMSIPEEHLVELKVLIDSIYVSGQRMLRNTKKLLTYSLFANDINNEIQITTSESNNIHDILVKSMDELNMHNTHYLDHVTLIAEKVDDCTCSAEHLRLIIDELIDNMIQFHVGDSSPIITLRKSGQGFELSFINQIKSPLNLNVANIKQFKKFHAESAMSGLGIGLYLVKKLCALMELDFTIKEEGNLISFIVSKL